MSTRRYSSPKTKRILFLVLLVLGASSCVSDDVWNIKKEELKTRIASSDFEFLKTLDLSAKNLSEALSLGPGAGYYMSRIFLNLKLTDLAYRMLTISYTNEKGIWMEASGMLLLDMLLNLGKTTDCEKYAKECIRISTDPQNQARAKRVYLKMLYLQRKDEELVKTLPQLFQNADMDSDPELLLYKAAAMTRLGKEDASKLFISLYLAPADKWIRTEAQTFLTGVRSTLLADPLLSKLMLARGLLDTEYKDTGYPLLEEACLSLDMKRVSSQMIVSDLVEEIALWRLTEKEYQKGISFISEFTKNLDGNTRLMALEMLGRLYRRAGNYTLAATALNEVVVKTGDKEQKDRALWYRLTSLKEAKSKDFLTELARAASIWDDPEYFDDILEETVNVLVSQRGWQDLHTLYEGLDGKESKQILSQISYILARVISLDFLKINDKEPRLLQLFEIAASAENANYHCFLASCFLNKTPPLFIKTESTDLLSSSPEAGTDMDEFVKGFFDFGLVEEGLVVLKNKVGDLTDEALFYSMKCLEEKGYYKDNIRITNKSAYLKLYQVSRDTIIRQYPKEYSSFIEEYAKRDKLEEYILYSLIREESAFDTAIVSRSGAVGLSQLMPETAKDTATLLGLVEYDLNDAKTNLSIGSSHFARLVRYFGSHTKALIAYNAGINRVKDWFKLYGDLPPDLFIEALPFWETRDYIRKVVSATFVYGYIYYTIPLSTIFATFFPGIKK